VRSRAAAAIGACGDPGALAPLATLLLEDDKAVRAAALAAMREISVPGALTLAAGALPPGSPALLELAREALRRPIGDIARPDLFAIALRTSLGIDDADGAPVALRDARRALLRGQIAGGSVLPPLPVRLAPLSGGDRRP
jgi:HEAT repeat protein